MCHRWWRWQRCLKIPYVSLVAVAQLCAAKNQPRFACKKNAMNRMLWNICNEIVIYEPNWSNHFLDSSQRDIPFCHLSRWSMSWWETDSRILTLLYPSFPFQTWLIVKNPDHGHARMPTKGFCAHVGAHHIFDAVRLDIEADQKMHCIRNVSR